ncbi:MAG: FAD-binding oxidoreductase [Anaerolineae bacterium]|nr:FAD-binding oxidoreductase [Anaerolineae bacterium]
MTVAKVDMVRLELALQGQLILPGDPEYDAARAVWNGMIDRYPALIARCETTQDVVTAVNFARQHDLLLSVRGGGHNVAGHATNDGGLVIDLSPLKQVVVDPERRTVRVGGGVTLGELDAATQQYGLALPTGVVSETGIAGLTLGGGFGWMRNKYGLTCDNLLAAEVVTADGRVLHTSERQNSDLFWGLRGGGGNFGIVTEFEFQAYPLGPEVMQVAVFHDGEAMGEVLRHFRDFCATAPDEISLLAVCGVFPPGAEMFPAELHGRHFVALIGVYIGAAAEGERVLQPLRNFRQPLFDVSSRLPYVTAQTFFDEDYPAGEMRYYWKSLNLTTLDDAAIDTLVEHARRQPAAHSTTDIWYNGGAIQRMDDAAMAFHGRHVNFVINPEANWEHPAEDEENIAWVRDFLAAMQPYSDGSRYLNFPGFQEEGDDMMRTAFASKYDKLVALKRKYDPTNLFSLNQNIKPG